ncbi:hypothetical protein CSPAE12_00669 [Colletotrichum incanum]|nr:hypothetical protein CSPAE12_00669 [Colletotrichum incanum]
MAKETGSANGTKHVGTYNVMPPHAEQSTVQSISGSEGVEQPPSAKALGKRPANRSLSGTTSSLKSPPTVEPRQKPVVVQTSGRAPAPAPLSRSITQDAYEHFSCITRTFVTKDWVLLVIAVCLLDSTHGTNNIKFRYVSTERGQYRSWFFPRAALECHGKHVQCRGHGPCLDIWRARPTCFGSFGVR